MMDKNYLEVGDVVKVINFDGSTGFRIKSCYGADTIFEVIKIERLSGRAEKHLADIKPPGSSDEPISAHWDRLKKIEGLKLVLPEPDMDLDEIHRAQELMR